MLNFLTPYCSTSYGICGVNLLTALNKLEKEVSLFPISGRIEKPADHHIEALEKALEKAKTFDYDAPSLRLYHQFALQESIGKGLKTGYTFFELDTLQPHEVHQLNYLDIVFSPSEWAKKVMIKNGVTTKIEILNPGIDKLIFDQAKPADITTDQKNTTIFLSCGKWEYRKAHDVILDAFNSAFEPNDNVLLITLCFNPIITNGFNGPEESKAWETTYLNSKMGQAKRINVINQRFETQSEIASIMKAVDCGLFPSRAEGWNMPAAEMLYLGKHCIMSDYSAHTEFAKNGGARLIPITELEEAYAPPFFPEGRGNWAGYNKDSFEQFVYLMRQVHYEKQNGELGINKQGRTLFSDIITWENSAKKLCAILEI